jgi:hypothetical protein
LLELFVIQRNAQIIRIQKLQLMAKGSLAVWLNRIYMNVGDWCVTRTGGTTYPMRQPAFFCFFFVCCGCAFLSAIFFCMTKKKQSY